MNKLSNFKAQARGLLLAATVFLSIPPSFSQISLKGTVDVNDYTGSQPELIDGISSIPASESPLIRHVYMVSQNIVGLIIDEKACILSNLKPYRAQKNDSIIMTGYHGLSKLLIRNEDSLGFLAGRKKNWYRPFNEIAGEELDLKWVSDPSNFVVSSPDDPEYNGGIHPLEIFRKSVPDEEVTRMRISPKPQSTHRHYIYLKLSANLTPGNHYKIRFNNDGPFQMDLSFQFDDRKLRSEEIHINLYGYEPEDEKISFLSSWMGDGGALQYPEDMHFRIINLKNNQTVYEGQPKLKQSEDVPEYVINGKAYNHNQTNVYVMDFSSLDEIGKYKLIVDGIGCSFDFWVDDNIWENTTRLLMKGFLHQRAGIELGPPYTDYIRPRNLHPEDGHIIHKCDPEKFFGFEGSSNFKRIQASILEDTSIPEAWGGWMDAGDYDRRMKHFYTVRRMMYLYELNPGYFEQLDFNLPESSNNIPDILDEGLWCLDLYRRTQGIYEKGGVSWWIESIEHPRHGETSWLNSLPTALVPPTPEACIYYSGTAAQMARLLKKYDENLAAIYQKSALDAMEWVENNPKVPVIFKRQDRKVMENLAYINLFRLTGNQIWHQRFQKSCKDIFPKGINDQLTIEKLDAIAIYALMDPSQVNQKLQDDCRAAVINLANELLEGSGEVTYGMLKLKNQPLTRLATIKSKVLPVVMAHKLTRDNKYKNALVKTIQYTMGLNPMNRSFISGLGERSFMPYHHDWHADILHIPAGIPNFGPVIQPEYFWENVGISDGWTESLINSLENDFGLYPAKLIDWPLTEKCFNQMWMPPVNEFMVESPMGELLLLTGYLGSCSN